MLALASGLRQNSPFLVLDDPGLRDCRLNFLPSLGTVHARRDTGASASLGYPFQQAPVVSVCPLTDAHFWTCQAIRCETRCLIPRALIKAEPPQFWKPGERGKTKKASPLFPSFLPPSSLPFRVLTANSLPKPFNLLPAVHVAVRTWRRRTLAR